MRGCHYSRCACLPGTADDFGGGRGGQGVAWPLWWGVGVEGGLIAELGCGPGLIAGNHVTTSC